MRRATRADVDAVRSLVRAAYAPWVPVIGREPRPMTADYARAIDEHVVEILDDIAVLEMVAEPDCLLIVNIAVAPDHQGRGLGTQLLARAEAFARDAQLPAIRLYTNAAMTSNIALYARHGYVETHRERIAVGEIVHMRLTLRD
ncbi:MAG: GNAT family N-acetyltransferase [Kofleriaceae bacterium]